MSKRNKDYLLKTIGFQVIICILIFGILFALKATSSEAFEDFDFIINSKLKENITFEEAKEVFLKVTDSFNATTESEGVTESSSEVELTETETVFVPFEEPALSAEIKAAGGNDIGIKSKNDIPDNVSTKEYTLNKKMIKPVIDGSVTSEFGARIHPISNELRFHAGIDIAKPSGSPIYSAFDGTVIEAASDEWNGNYIKLSHDNDIVTVYCHCNKLNVKKGQIIRAGEVIGTVGSTGNSTGPHLHFELRINGKSYNPEFALREAESAI